MSVEVDRPVPDFSAVATSGPLLLSQLRGRKLLLYFYPKDNTSGCTTEGREFAATYEDFVACATEVIGVSRDSLKSHLGFMQKLDLPFALIADPDEALCQLFGVIKNKTLYGRAVRGIERSTFLIDARGVLRQQWRGVKVAGHVAQTLAAARALE